jgi:hypothetical protein
MNDPVRKQTPRQCQLWQQTDASRTEAQTCVCRRHHIVHDVINSKLLCVDRGLPIYRSGMRNCSAAGYLLLTMFKQMTQNDH